MRRAYIGSLVIVGALMVCAWLVAQPFFVLEHIRDAAMRADLESLVKLVDFRALRENLKASVNVRLAKRIVSDPRGNTFEGLRAVLADALGDAYVPPGGIGMLAPGKRLAPGGTPALERTVRVRQGYASTSEFRVTVQSDTSRTAAITFILRRRGFSWMLTDVRMPLLQSVARGGTSP